jgi:hypothetical protein
MVGNTRRYRRFENKFEFDQYEDALEKGLEKAFKLKSTLK